MLDSVSVRPSSPVLIGREQEFAHLRAAAGQAVSGTPVTVLVGGEAGIGKTRLIEEFVADQTEHGARVLIGDQS